MNEAELMDSFNGQCDFRHVETSNVFREDLILNEHSHQITTRQEFHQHVQERAILKGCVKLDDPRTVRLSKNITFRANMCKLVLLELQRQSASVAAPQCSDLPFQT
jgi:hypothetical protein